MENSGWKRYLQFLDASPYSTSLLASNLAPQERLETEQRIRVDRMNYSLFPFQQRILDNIKGDALVVGLPTGLGKTYLAGAFIARESSTTAKRVLFLVPSVPLGVQQTLFARKMLNVKGAYFISGNIPPEKRTGLGVWKAGYIVTTPQTFYNDFLADHERELRAAKASDDPVSTLKGMMGSFQFPFDILVADECHGYIGETDGYSIMLSAKACGVKILALSATPQLHSPIRLGELKKIFGQIEVFSIEDPDIKAFIPERSISLVRVFVPPKLLLVYNQLANVIKDYKEKVKRAYGAQHLRGFCKGHPLCISLLALRIMRTRIVEDGASSVLNYGIWRLRELRVGSKELGGKSIYDIYRETLKSTFNHKFTAIKEILRRNKFEKAIVFVESVESAKQLGVILQGIYGLEEVAILVGKGSMTMEQQASALLHFKEKAKVLVCTSIGEEGLDIPVADLEVWMDPPSNPRKWIQRFGRVLRQSGKKKVAKIYALVSMKTHERNKLMAVMRRVERVYGFTQELREEPLKLLESGQKEITYYI
ncbi:MAG: DEAD/DEAH box helicase family protein [Candidatus Methanomethyliales bacterium]|nr:DEAD/DEAH box helicase family protein [Candidatus Methanomethylicales archaeon]